MQKSERAQFWSMMQATRLTPGFSGASHLSRCAKDCEKAGIVQRNDSEVGVAVRKRAGDDAGDIFRDVVWAAPRSIPPRRKGLQQNGPAHFTRRGGYG